MQILHLSDIHYKKDYPNIENDYSKMLNAMENPLVFLDQCLNEVLASHSIDLILISGDLTESGDASDYAYLRSHIESITGSIDIMVTLGNHDHKDAFYEGWLKTTPSLSPYLVQKDYDDLVILSLDNSRHGDNQGIFTPESLDWLRFSLKKAKDKPILLMTHHHLLSQQTSMPIASGTEQFKALLGGKNIIGILNGHTHHHYAGEFANIPYFTNDSMSFCGNDSDDGIIRFEEQYGYSIYHITDSRIAHIDTHTYRTGKLLKAFRF